MYIHIDITHLQCTQFSWLGINTSLMPLHTQGVLNKVIVQILTRPCATGTTHFKQRTFFVPHQTKIEWCCTALPLFSLKTYISSTPARSCIQDTWWNAPRGNYALKLCLTSLQVIFYYLFTLRLLCTLIYLNTLWRNYTVRFTMRHFSFSYQ